MSDQAMGLILGASVLYLLYRAWPCKKEGARSITSSLSGNEEIVHKVPGVHVPLDPFLPRVETRRDGLEISLK